jgi:hypothetical protein
MAGARRLSAKSYEDRGLAGSALAKPEDCAVVPSSHSPNDFLVTAPGATAEALRSVLRSIPELEVIESVAGCLSAAQAIRSLTPALVVISDQLPAEEIPALIRHPMRGDHAPGIVVLSISHAREQRFLDAGAFAVVTPWDSIEQLQTVIHNAAMYKTVDFVEPQPTARRPLPGEAAMGNLMAGL